MANQLHILLSTFLEPQRVEFMAIAAKRIATNAEKIRQDAIMARLNRIHLLKDAINARNNDVEKVKNSKAWHGDASLIASYTRLISEFQTELNDKEVNGLGEIEKRVTDYESKTIRSYANHFDNAIIKLVARIQKEGLNIEKTTIIKPDVDIDVTGFVTDGQIHIKCTTIQAWGDVQRLHYRFLTKRVKDIK